MNILILAAGYGTRLYPLTVNAPKPLLLINNKPLINFLIEKIDNLKKHFSIKKVKIVSNNKFYKNFLDWKKKYNLEVEILNDRSNAPEDRIGAVGDIKFAIEEDHLKDWLVLGGDNLFKDDLSGFLDFSLKAKPYPCVGLYDVKEKEIATRFATVKVNLEGKITELKEKPKEPTSTLISTCIYFFPSTCWEFLNLFLREEDNLDTSGKYIEWLVKKTRVYGYKLGGEWLDIGHKDSLEFAERRFKEKRCLKN